MSVASTSADVILKIIQGQIEEDGLVQITSIPANAAIGTASRGLKYIKPRNTNEEKS
jgi:hypothetical protein